MSASVSPSVGGVESCRVAVIGAGASGLCCALSAGEGVLVLEAAQKPGKKLLATGGGRCNMTSLRLDPGRYMGDGALSMELLRRWTPRRLTDRFHELGLFTRADSEGRVYPYSMRAAGVLDVLLACCREAGVRCLYGYRVQDISRDGGGFLITAAGGRRVRAKYCVLAAGGRASPQLSGGEGYSLAEGLGHSVTELSPALSGIRVKSPLPGRLRGLRCRGRASLLLDRRELWGEEGEMLFGDGHVSGICVMDLSSRLRDLPPGEPALRLDLAPELSPQELRGRLLAIGREHPGRRDTVLGLLDPRLGRELAALAKNGGPQRLAWLIKNLDLPIEGPLGWDRAQVTAGGVPLGEVDLGGMESRICPGLYLCGELLDVDGPCGGYNLHWAFATGFAAGEALKNRKGE